MRLFKQLTSALLSVAIIAGTAATGLTVRTKAAATDSPLLYSTVINQWEYLIRKEMMKFPEGKYWNCKYGNSSEDSCSGERCYNTRERVAKTLCCNSTAITDVYSTSWRKIERENEANQCSGFANKLSKDIWGTTELVRYENINSYEPKIGDIVRLEFPMMVNGKKEYPGHSIFITKIENGIIHFAECNGEMEDCKIIWDRSRYYHCFNYTNVQYKNDKGEMEDAVLYKGNVNTQCNVTIDYLRAHAKYYERPAVAGDLNLDSRIDSADVQIFQDTVMKNGHTVNVAESAPFCFYDMNGDGYVSTADFELLKGGSANMRIIMPGEKTTCQWNTIKHRDGFRYGDSYYVKNNVDGVSWIGAVDNELTSLTIPSKVKDSSGNWLTVTEIGYDSLTDGNNGMQVERSCTRGSKISLLTIPETVNRIRSYAFWESDIAYLYLNGNNPQLKLIDSNAFYNCQMLSCLDISKAKNLETIGDYAFAGCNQMWGLYLPYTTHTLNLGTSAKGTIFDNEKSNTTTLYFINNTGYQKLKFGSKDINNYWTKGKIKMYGKMFMVYQGDQYISRKGSSTGYLYAPQ